MENKLKIAIIKLSSLGDIVHCAIVLQFIKRFVPDAHISWFADSKFSEILRFNEGIDEVISLPLKARKFKQSWQIINAYKGKFDIIIDFQGLLKSAIIARMLGCNIFGFDKNSAKEKIASIFYSRKFSCDYAKNIILRNLELCSFALNFSFEKDEIVNKKQIFKAPEFSEFSASQPAGSEFSEFSKILKSLENSKIVLIAPFASEKSKCYNDFKSIIKGLEGAAACLVLAGSPKEKAVADELILGTEAILLYPLSLGEILLLLERCDLVVGNDSGISHIAWAQNCATITLFGNRLASRNTFDTAKNISFQATPKHEIDARHIDKSDFCINTLKAKEIIKSALKLLGLDNA